MYFVLCSAILLCSILCLNECIVFFICNEYSKLEDGRYRWSVRIIKLSDRYHRSYLAVASRCVLSLGVGFWIFFGICVNISWILWNG